MKYENNKIVYEVGDWVTIINLIDPSGGFFNGKVGEAFRISRINKDWIAGDWTIRGEIIGNAWLPQNLRPATQEEIDKALGKEKIMIGGYGVEFLGDDNNREGNCHKIKVGCQTVSKEVFLKIGKGAGWL